jgi:hypothetical protein
MGTARPMLIYAPTLIPVMIDKSPFIDHINRNSHRLEEPAFLARFGFVYVEYNTSCYAYESIVMLRKVLLSAVLVFLSAYSISRTVQVSVQKQLDGVEPLLWIKC